MEESLRRIFKTKGAKPVTEKWVSFMLMQRIHVHVCMCAHLYVYVYIFMYMCVHVCTCVDT